jgi:hypothetical protein
MTGYRKLSENWVFPSRDPAKAAKPAKPLPESHTNPSSLATLATLATPRGQNLKSQTGDNDPFACLRDPNLIPKFRVIDGGKRD